MVLNPGEQFAGYTIESVLGTGGMGAVYLAQHPRLPRRDALKLLNPAFSNDPNFRARFEREANVVAGLVHRNIVAVYDRGAVDGQLWISMQYVAGVDASVAARANDGSMTPDRVVHIVSEVGAGLDYAHRAGLLHRDVKPANILLAAPDDPTEPEHVLLTDFGIAKSAGEGQQHLTGTGNLLATLAYASPEQIEAKPLDHRVDIYALGCVLFELLTGSVPYPEPTPFATMTAHLKNPIPKVTERVPWLPPGMDAVVAKALAKNAEDRYSTCRELSLAARAALVAADPALSTPTRAEFFVPPPRGGIDHPPTTGHGPTTDGVPNGVVVTTPRPPYLVGVRRTNQAQRSVAELAPINTGALPATDRIEVERILLEEVHFFDLPPQLRLVEVVPGDVTLEITVANQDVTRTVLYQREGSRHPKGLDDLVALLERHAGWQTRQLTTGSHLPGWTPTGSVPPIGLGAVRPTEVNYQPPPGYHPTGPHGAPPPGGFQQSGPHVGYQTGPAQHLGGTATTGGKKNGKKWLLVGLVAALVIAGGVTAFLLTRGGGGTSIAAPTNLVAAVDDQRNVSVTWTGSSGATGYTLSQNGQTVYQGAATRWTDEKANPGTYSYEVTATNSASQTSPSSNTAYVTVQDASGWGAQVSIVEAFPDLLPASPAETGYDGADCSVSSDTDNSKADGIINCIANGGDYDGVFFEVRHFPTTDDRDAYLDRQFGDAPVKVGWTDANDNHAGNVYRTKDDFSDVPYIVTTFDAPALADYVLYVHWRDHTTKELIDGWWQYAPFYQTN